MLLRSFFRSLYAGRALIAALGDALCVIFAATLAWFVLPPDLSAQAFIAGALVATVAATLALTYCEAYGSEVLGSASRTLHAITLAVGLLAMAFAFSGALAISAGISPTKGIVATIALGAAFYIPMLFGERALFRFAAARIGERVIVIGLSDLGAAIARLIRQRPNLGIELVGFLSDREDQQGGELEGFPVLGRVSELEKLMENHAVDRVVVASKDRNETFPAEQLLAFKLRGTPVDSGLELYERSSGRIYLKNLRTSYLIFSEGFLQGHMASVTKRSLDIVVSSLALLVSAPLLALAAIAMRLETRGPVIYWQDRVGFDGCIFPVAKLRTMQDGAEDESGPVFADEDDPRITRVGRVLRKTRLDEVPQFWNVLRGEMSVVGPRPERPEWVETLTARHPLFRWRATVKPGLTGWAQIRYGYVNDLEDFEQKLALDLFYMKHRSLGFDLLILWETVKTVVLFKGL